MKESTFSMVGINNEYEDLRCNILGKTNCCRGLVVFLRQGMVAWMSMLRTLAKKKILKQREHATRVDGSNERGVVASELAVVLADVIIAAHGLH
ncbi:MAG: hypothetical protein KAH23_09550 [Kiritimatiellae bacterium]|nr:hypothetical protein [Kiritimatiellia bacterium]